MEQDQAKTNKLMELFLSEMFLNTIAQRQLVEFDNRSEIRLENPQHVIKYSGNLEEDFREILGTEIGVLRASNAIIPKVLASPIIIPKTESPPLLATNSDESNVNPLAELPSAKGPHENWKKKSRSAKLAELEMQMKDVTAAKKPLVGELNVSPQHNEELVTQPPPMIHLSAEPLASPPVLETVSGESNINSLDELFAERAPFLSETFESILEEQFLINEATRTTDQVKLKANMLHYGQLNLNLDKELGRFSYRELEQLKNKIVAKLRQSEMHLKKDEDPLKNQLIALLNEIRERIKCHKQLREANGRTSKKNKT
ncbi:MAG TPA: hypothetical protein VHO47_02715 [Candidatus Babeliales bacterium]|nr:hypothetical protein [Candidatus Babeliales bacterium]